MRDEKKHQSSHRSSSVWFAHSEGPTVYVRFIRDKHGCPQVLTSISDSVIGSRRVATFDHTLSSGDGTLVECTPIELACGQVLCVRHVRLFEGEKCSNVVSDQVGYILLLCQKVQACAGPGLAIVCPAFGVSIQDATNQAQKAGYKASVFVGGSEKSKMLTHTNARTKRLMVKACAPEDIYMIRCPQDQREMGFAKVQTYQQSVALNAIFRNVEENQWLDSQEESDDEETFENISPRKWVRDQSWKEITCSWDGLRRGWVPHVD